MKFSLRLTRLFMAVGLRGVLFFLLLVPSVVSSAGLPQAAELDRKKKPTPTPTPAVIISSAISDLVQHTITISGQNFGSVAPSVFLGTMELVVNTSSATSIQATLPESLASGSYRLTVTTAVGASSEFDVTLGMSDAGGHTATLVFNRLGSEQSSPAVLTILGGISFNGWQLQAPVYQNDLSLSFSVPDDLDSNQPITVNVHFVTLGSASPVPPGNVLLSCNSLFGNTPTPSFMTATAQPQSVSEPPLPPGSAYIPYNHYVVTFVLSGQALPGVFGLLDFTRASQADTFSDNIFLTGVTIQYTRH